MPTCLERIHISDDRLDEAVMLLDDAEIENDIDDGGRIMVTSDELETACCILEKECIDYEII